MVVVRRGRYAGHHALKVGGYYRVERLTGGESTWQEIVMLAGEAPQRVMVQLATRCTASTACYDTFQVDWASDCPLLRCAQQ